MISPYFTDLLEKYRSDLDDLEHDSQGHRDFDRRLEREKRQQFGALLAYAGPNPELAIPALYDAFHFLNSKPLAQAAGSAPGLAGFPTWQELERHLTVDGWANALVEQVKTRQLADPFLTVAAVAEYLRVHGDGAAGAGEDDNDHGHDDETADDAEDLAEQGGAFLETQGFDTLTPEGE